MVAGAGRVQRIAKANGSSSADTATPHWSCDQSKKRDPLFAGRTPIAAARRYARRKLINRFLTSKEHLVEVRELPSQSFADFHRTSSALTSRISIADYGPAYRAPKSLKETLRSRISLRDWEIFLNFLSSNSVRTRARSSGGNSLKDRRFNSVDDL